MPRPRLHDDTLRQRLLETASRMIADDGLTAFTVRDVAGRSGTSASAVYALFGSRAALVAAVREEAERRFAAHLAAVSTTADPGADLLDLGLAYRTSALADPHFYRVMFDAETGPDAEDVTSRTTFVVLRDAVARLLADPSGGSTGRVRPSAVEPALILWGLVHGLVGLELNHLLPGDVHQRAARYVTALRAAGPGIVAAGTQVEASDAVRR